MSRGPGAHHTKVLLLAVCMTAAALPVRSQSDAPAVRLQVDAPGVLGHATFALSPDGRMLAFAGATNSTPGGLWLRQLDSTSVQLLAGTRGAANPFWAPDGRSVGFFANNQLRTIDLATGTVRALCAARGSRTSGTWNQDGVILFSTDVQNPIRRVDARGGTPVAATTGEAFRPNFLPDGQRFLYTGQGGVYIGVLDVLQGALVARASNPNLGAANLPEAKYAAGYLLFVEDRSLVARAFDLASGRASIGQMRIGEVGRYTGAVANHFSVSAGVALAYQQAAGPSQLVWYDRSGRRRSVVGPRGLYSSPELLSDGSRLAVEEIDDATRRHDVWVFDLARKNIRTRLTTPIAQALFNETRGQLSPDGRWLAYTSNQVQRTNELYVQSFPTATIRVRVSPAGGDHARWRQDGKELFYVARDGALMSVAFTAGSTPTVGVPRLLFQTQLLALGELGSRAEYDVTADGKRFIINEPVVDAATPPITVVLNWTAGPTR